MVPLRLNFLFTFVLFIVRNVHSASVKRVGPHPSAEYSVDVSMPGVKPDAVKTFVRIKNIVQKNEIILGRTVHLFCR